ncbi:type II toxin-antitoxin system RelE/ParE family toxin [Aureibaculum luteum]|uniref:type II toxin-antitoxin system RelE/ParE family toxin n=1 Tax=Aureibaculum luteum TaxID=1548456 RepID=UPI000E4F0774|nr:type II toxin-antitoxin system RelE/ParE family toxin [Aureibaculum luteum]
MMIDKNFNYQLSKDADQDLDSIFDYTEKEHSFDQAIKYLSEIEETFFQIASSPNLGKERVELKRGIYSLQVNYHLVFYKIHSDHVLIVRVLHGRRDLPKFIK